MSENGARARCKARTRSSKQCKNPVSPASDYCHIHRVMIEEQQLREVSPEYSDRELGRALAEELDLLIERLQALSPEYSPPPFSPQALIALIENNVSRLSPGLGLGLLQWLRKGLNQDFFNVDTWKGIWYMLNYSLEYRGDMLKRRLTGEYETDEWGLDREFLEAVAPFFQFMYEKYWRVETSGIENIPNDGRALLVANHSGQ